MMQRNGVLLRAGLRISGIFSRQTCQEYGHRELLPGPLKNMHEPAELSARL